MNKINIREKINSIFPIHWENDICEDLDNTLHNYVEMVKQFDDFAIYVNDITTICDTLVEVIREYLYRDESKAFTLFENLMNGENGLFNYIDRYVVNNDDSMHYFRARHDDSNEKLKREDMFHCPLKYRDKVNEQRYNDNGHPCLYLGNTIYSCWKELHCPKSGYLMVSAYKVKEKFSLYDLRIPSSIDYSEDKTKNTLYRLPLIIASSITTNDNKIYEKQEYIVSRLLMQMIFKTSSEITFKEKSPLDIDVSWGVIYTSTRAENCNDWEIMQNIAIPTVTENNQCSYLSYLFSLTESKNFECEKLSIFLMDQDNVSSAEQRLRIMDIDRSVTTNNIYDDFKYIIFDNPKTVNIPQEGGSITLNIKSNGPWSVDASEQ